MANDPRLEPNWSAESWRQHPLGIEQLNHLSCAVRDVGEATRFMAGLLGADPVHAGVRSGVGSLACFWLGDTMLELIEPTDVQSPVAVYMERYGPRMRSLLWKVVDLDRAEAHLRGKGLRVGPGDEQGWLAIDPRDNFGVLWQFTEDPGAGDPRFRE